LAVALLFLFWSVRGTISAVRDLDWLPIVLDLFSAMFFGALLIGAALRFANREDELS
jgi:hypothetical protein